MTGSSLNNSGFLPIDIRLLGIVSLFWLEIYCSIEAEREETETELWVSRAEPDNYCTSESQSWLIMALSWVILFYRYNCMDYWRTTCIKNKCTNRMQSGLNEWDWETDRLLFKYSFKSLLKDNSLNFSIVLSSWIIGNCWIDNSWLTNIA